MKLSNSTFLYDLNIIDMNIYRYSLQKGDIHTDQSNQTQANIIDTNLTLNHII